MKRIVPDIMNVIKLRFQRGGFHPCVGHCNLVISGGHGLHDNDFIAVLAFLGSADSVLQQFGCIAVDGEFIALDALRLAFRHPFILLLEYCADESVGGAGCAVGVAECKRGFIIVRNPVRQLCDHSRIFRRYGAGILQSRTVQCSRCGSTDGRKQKSSQFLQFHFMTSLDFFWNRYADRICKSSGNMRTSSDIIYYNTRLPKKQEISG